MVSNASFQNLNFRVVAQVGIPPALILATVKPVYNGFSKIDKTKVLMTNGSLMKVESTAECSHTFNLH